MTRTKPGNEKDVKGSLGKCSWACSQSRHDEWKGGWTPRPRKVDAKDSRSQATSASSCDFWTEAIEALLFVSASCKFCNGSFHTVTDCLPFSSGGAGDRPTHAAFAEGSVWGWKHFCSYCRQQLASVILKEDSCCWHLHRVAPVWIFGASRYCGKQDLTVSRYQSGSSFGTSQWIIDCMFLLQILTVACNC